MNGLIVFLSNFGRNRKPIGSESCVRDRENVVEGYRKKYENKKKRKKKRSRFAREKSIVRENRWKINDSRFTLGRNEIFVPIRNA